jgi:hypothetical protein
LNIFSATWEKRPLYICREMPEYYSALLSTEKFDKMLREVSYCNCSIVLVVFNEITNRPNNIFSE